MDFQEKFEELIESYNAGSRNIEELFEELLKLSRNLSAEQQRHVRESMSEEELVIFDILTRPAPDLSPDEHAEVKKVAPRIPQPRQILLILLILSKIPPLSRGSRPQFAKRTTFQGNPIRGGLGKPIWRLNPSPSFCLPYVPPYLCGSILTIEDTLDAGLPRAYTPDLYQQKCSAVFEHVYENYTERDVNTYVA
jgi:type I restriction enzyme, R subunit